MDPIPAPPAPAGAPRDCEACRFAVAATLTGRGGAALGARMIGCAFHNVLRLRQGQGCADHAEPAGFARVAEHLVARSRRARRLEAEGLRHG